jgi:chemotaxis protein CheD
MSLPPNHTDLFLPPGGLWFGSAPRRVRTLLGSCVAMTVWHPVSRAGGMCHYMLPSRACRPTNTALDGRYGDEALTWLLQRMQAVHADRKAWQVKLFGGGAMFTAHPGVPFTPAMQVQRRNVECALLFASQHGLEVKAQDLGGAGHRSLVFELTSGDVWVRHTPPTPAQHAAFEREAA